MRVAAGARAAHRAGENRGTPVGVLLTGRRAERFDRLVDGRLPATRTGERERLDVVMALRACQPVSPRAEFRASLRVRLLAENPTAENPTAETVTPAEPARSPAAPAHDAWNILKVRPALIGALATSVVVTGIAVGTHRAVPGEPFYGLKLRVEHIQLDLTSSRVEKAKVHLDLARTRLDEIRTIMDDGRLPKKTTDVRDLLVAWQTEASTGGEVLVAEARGGSQDAFQAVQAFTTAESRNLGVLLDSLPDGPLHAMTADALDYVHGVRDTLSDVGIAAASKPGSPSGTPTRVGTSYVRQPAGNSGGTPPVSSFASPVPVPGPDIPSNPATSNPAVSVAAGPDARTGRSPGNAQAPTAAPPSPSASAMSAPTDAPATDIAPETVVAQILDSADPG